MLSMIFANDKNYLIGKDNGIPWDIPNDLGFFKAMTTGKTIIMGRKTFESFKKPLPNRHHVVLTRNRDFKAEGCDVFHHIDDVLAYIKQFEDQEVIVIGGAEIYVQFFPYADRLYITYIDHEFEGDTHLPKFDLSDWRLTSKEKGIKNAENPYDYYFLQYDRN